MEADTHFLVSKFPAGKHDARVFFNPACLNHDPGPQHPERPARLQAVLDGCRTLPDDTPVGFVIPPSADRTAMARVHDTAYLQALEEACLKGKETFMSQDNPICVETYRAVQASAGLGIALGEHLSQGGAGFALTRPPGHHAGRARAEGFCFTDQIALAIETIRINHPDARFLAVDFDVHHGNGIHYQYNHDPSVFFFSIHGSPAHIYPGTGYDSERGIDDGEGYTRNITVELGSSGDHWLDLFHEGLHDSIATFTPDFLLVSAGFDAHTDDPFSFLNVEDEHYLEVMTSLEKAAEKHCQGRLGLTLEGGYSTKILGRLVPACIAHLAAWRNAAQPGG